MCIVYMYGVCLCVCVYVGTCMFMYVCKGVLEGTVCVSVNVRTRPDGQEAQ